MRIGLLHGTASWYIGSSRLTPSRDHSLSYRYPLGSVPRLLAQQRSIAHDTFIVIDCCGLLQSRARSASWNDTLQLLARDDRGRRTHRINRLIAHRCQQTLRLSSGPVVGEKNVPFEQPLCWRASRREPHCRGGEQTLSGLYQLLQEATRLES